MQWWSLTLLNEAVKWTAAMRMNTGLSGQLWQIRKYRHPSSWIIGLYACTLAAQPTGSGPGLPFRNALPTSSLTPQDGVSDTSPYTGSCTGGGNSLEGII